MMTSLIESVISPVIISASRATDIPAFYSNWFIDQLKRGSCLWRNPYSKKMTKVSFEETRVIVFWTKNPKPLIPYLSVIEDMGINYYFQYTLNDYEGTGLEPSVDSLQNRIATFVELSEKLGKGRVIWRYDPLIKSNVTPRSYLIDSINKVGNQLYQHTEKLVFSFADIEKYGKVKIALNSIGINAKEFTSREQEILVQDIVKTNQPWGLELATCGEGGTFDNVSKNKCVDGELMARLFPDDHKLIKYLGFGKQVLKLPISIPGQPTISEVTPPKDSGQRELCGCIKSKDIGQYSTCKHGCVYCYAGGNGNTVDMI